MQTHLVITSPQKEHLHICIPVTLTFIVWLYVVVSTKENNNLDLLIHGQNITNGYVTPVMLHPIDLCETCYWKLHIGSSIRNIWLAQIMKPNAYFTPLYSHELDICFTVATIVCT